MVQVLGIKGLWKKYTKLVSQSYLHYSSMKRSITELKDQYFVLKHYIEHWSSIFFYIFACLPEVSTYISGLSLEIIHNTMWSLFTEILIKHLEYVSVEDHHERIVKVSEVWRTSCDYQLKLKSLLLIHLKHTSAENNWWYFTIEMRLIIDIHTPYVINKTAWLISETDQFIEGFVFESTLYKQ